MKQFETINILDMIGAIGETKLKQCLSEFSCPVNPEIEHFVVDHAIEFAKKKLSVTYFVINENGKIIAGTTNKEKTAFIDTEKTMLEMASSPAFHGQNTTIGVIATNAALTKAEAKKIAGMAHDGLARAIRPVHTQLDGDTIFCLSTGEIQSPKPIVDLIGTLAARVTEQTVIRAVKKANAQ